MGAFNYVRQRKAAGQKAVHVPYDEFLPYWKTHQNLY
jgi:hypothetical protein